ncbi:SpoIIE family protein phosphatase [bacterium]|nr:SpoIIE family protein phosphatase [bacterium]
MRNCDPLNVQLIEGSDDHIELIDRRLGLAAVGTVRMDRVELDSDDTPLTDGVTEAELPHREMFGQSHVVECDRSAIRGEPTVIIDGVLAAVREFCAGTPRADDLTVVVVRCHDGERRDLSLSLAGTAGPTT